MGLFRRSSKAARPTDQLPAPVDVDTLAGAAQLGMDGGSGMVPRHRAWTDPDMGGRVDLLPGYVQSVGQLDSPRIPDSWFTDRLLRGGVRSSPHFGEFIAEPGNTGGHTVITGRLPFVIGDVEVMPADSAPEASFREPPTPQVCRSVPVIL